MQSSMEIESQTEPFIIVKSAPSDSSKDLSLSLASLAVSLNRPFLAGSSFTSG